MVDHRGAARKQLQVGNVPHRQNLFATGFQMRPASRDDRPHPRLVHRLANDTPQGSDFAFHHGPEPDVDRRGSRAQEGFDLVGKLRRVYIA